MLRLLPFIIVLAAIRPASAGDFPLRVSKSQRYLETVDRRPFLVVGDTAWSLVAQLSMDDAADYLEDRRKRGFNAVIVNLLEHRFADRAPASIDGTRPFPPDGDFRRPNPKYFDHAARVIDAANQRGISVWLCPAYLGWQGGDEGFFQQVKRAGPKALRAYGKFVGERFRNHANVVWMVGGDYAMPEAERWAGTELAEGIREGGARQLMTAHGGQTSAVNTFGEREWLDLNNVYSYHLDLWKEYHAAYREKPTRPYVLIESAYEGEHHATPDRIRRQAWWAMLCGGCGQFFGNNPIWYLDGPGFQDRKAAPTWREALNLPGSRDMSRLGSFFREFAWQNLVPDLDDAMVTAGGEQDATKVIASRGADRKLAVAYVPSTGKTARPLTLNLSALAGEATAHWFNPAREANKMIAAGRLSNAPGRKLETPGDNGTGTNDWVLVLEVR